MKQLKWRANPISIDEIKYKQIKLQLEKQDKKEKTKHVIHARQEYLFEKQLFKSKIDLNDILVTFIDLKYTKIWSDSFIKEVKWYFKDLSFYFRIVKQGSVLCYLTFHIFTILSILFMAVIRQSLVSIGYFLILVPNLKDAADVLKQRIFQQNKRQIEVQFAIEEITEWFSKTNTEELEENFDDQEEREKRELMKLAKQEELEKLQTELRELTKHSSSKSYEEKKDEMKKQRDKEWFIIYMIKRKLLTYACLDFFFQVITQLSLIDYDDDSYWMTVIGFRKIWNNHGDQSYDFRDLIMTDNYMTMRLRWEAFGFEMLNCGMICIISLQSQIFDSYGYQKFIAQKDSSMDMLMKLAETKAKSIAFVYNNYKIRQIYKIQHRKEVIMATVEKLKEKVVKWRQFTRATLDNVQMVGNYTDKHSELNDPLVDQSFDNMGYISASATSKMRTSMRLEKVGHGITHGRSTLTKKTTTNRKTVRIDEELNEHLGDDPVANTLEDYKIVRQKREALKKMSQGQSKELQLKLAKEFVESKMKRVNCLTKLYLWLNKNFTEQILFKNRPKRLNELFETHCKGEIYVPTELEQMMEEEVL